MAYKRLGDVLIDAGLITEDQLGHALKQQKETKRRLGDELIAEGVITEAGLIEALQMQLGVEFVDLSAIDLDPELSRVISKNVARQYNVVPVRTSPDEVCLAMSDPLNFMAIEAVKNATRKRVIPMVTTHDSLMRAIMTLYGNEGAARAIEEMKRDARTTGADDASTGSFQTSTLGDDADAQSAPTVRLVNSIIERAATERASDIHLEPREIDLHVRMRIDGTIVDYVTLQRSVHQPLIARIKIMANLDIAERVCRRTVISVSVWDRASTSTSVYRCCRPCSEKRPCCEFWQRRVRSITPATSAWMTKAMQGSCLCSTHRTALFISPVLPARVSPPHCTWCSSICRTGR